MNLYLIGYRCTGKTSVGKCLARRLGRTFVDTDAMVAEAAGIPIAEIVARQGWAAFRDQEAAVLADVSAGSGQVVATGGGAVLHPENRRLMRHTGLAVWLTARLATIMDRLQRDATSADQRPSLTADDVEVEIRHTLEERLPLYAQMADLALATDFLDVDAVCDEIVRWSQRVKADRQK